VSGTSDDGTRHAFEAKAVSLAHNHAKKTVKFLISNLKPDVPRLVLTIFNWFGDFPRAAVVYMPDHMKWGSHRKKMKDLGVAGDSFEAIVAKLSKGDGMFVHMIDLLDPNIESLIRDILPNCTNSSGLDQNTMMINKAALENIISLELGLVPTGIIGSDFDATDSNGRRIEIKTGTIAQCCDGLRLMATLSWIKPKKHDSLLAAFHLPIKDKLIIINDFKSKPGRIYVYGNSLCGLLAHAVELSGGDKETLLASIYGGLGGAEEIMRLEDDIHKLMKDAVRPYANSRRLESCLVRVTERRTLRKADPETRAKDAAKKHAYAKLLMKGYSAKIIKMIDNMPLKSLRPEQSAEDARKEMLEEAAAVESMKLRARAAELQRKYRAAKQAKLVNASLETSVQV
jgi:hypothetical protein